MKAEEMREERAMISTSGPRSTYVDIHSLLKSLYLKAWCVDALIQRYLLAKDAQLRALKREFGNNIQQTILRPKFLRFLPEGPATWPTEAWYFLLQHPPPGRLGASQALNGNQWVNGGAGTIVKGLICQLLIGVPRSAQGASIADRKINNFLARFRA